MTLIYLYKSRGITKDITILDGSGLSITPDSGDKVRAVIGREGKLEDDLSGALLVVTSGDETANGSSFTLNTPEAPKNRLRLDASDLAEIPAGVYTLFIDFFDSSDHDEWKNVDRQVLCVEDT